MKSLSLSSFDRKMPDLHVSVLWRVDQGLELEYRCEGSGLEEVNWPATREKGTFRSGLWKETCCEIFLAIRGSSSYRELNFSPNGDYALFTFSDYRKAQPMSAELNQWLSNFRGASITHGRFCLKFSEEDLKNLGLSLEGLEFHPTLVLESKPSKILHYYAHRHPKAQPDFHNRSHFIPVQSN